MKNIFLKIAKVKDEGGFYKKYPTEQSFYEAHPQFMGMMRFRNGGSPMKRYSMNRYAGGGPFNDIDYTSPDYDAQAAMDAAANTIKEVDTPVQTNSNTGSTQSTITPSTAPTGQGAPPKASNEKATDKNFFTKSASIAGKALDMYTRNPAATIGNLGNAYLSLGALGSSRSVNSYENAQKRADMLSNSSLNTIGEANTINPTGYFENGGGYRRYSLSRMSKGGGIHINPRNKGKFTEAAHRAGYSSVQEYASHVLANKNKYSPLLVKRANFARNAKLFKHEDGGPAIESKDVLDFVRVQLENGADQETILNTLVKKYNVPEQMAAQAIMYEMKALEEESENVGEDGQEYQDEDIQGVPDQDLEQAYNGGPGNMYTNPYGNPYKQQRPQQNVTNVNNKPRSNVWDFGSSAMGAAGKIGGELAKNPKALEYINSWMGKAPLDMGMDAAANTATEAATNAATTAGSTAAGTAGTAGTAAGNALGTAAGTAGTAAGTLGTTAATLGETAATAGTALAGAADAGAAATQGLLAAGEGLAAAGEAGASLASLAVVRNGGRPKRYTLNVYTGNTDPRARRVINKATKMDNGGLYEGQEVDLDPYTLSYLKSIGYEFE